MIELLNDIPGLNVKSIEDPVAETGLDMSAFPNEKHLCSWVGIAPGNNESAGKKRSGRITPGNRQAKAAIVEAAWATTRTKNTFYSARYHRLAARRGKKRALIAAGHSILKSVYHILSTSCVYREPGADHVNLRAEAKRMSYLRKELEKLGYEVRLTDSKTVKTE